MNDSNSSRQGSGTVVVGVPTRTLPPMVSVLTETSSRKLPVRDLEKLSGSMQVVALADVFSTLGHFKKLPPRFRDLMTEYVLTNTGRTPLRSVIPSRRNPVNERWEFDFSTKDLWTGASRLASEVQRRELTEIYRDIDLPNLGRLFDASTHGVLVDATVLEHSPNAEELRPILRRRDLRTGRVRSSYRCATNGRAYANRPPLQNLHREDRGAVIAPPGYWLVEVDIKAADLAALAGLSRDRNLLAQFQPGQDIHMFTARLAAGAGTPARDIGKTLNMALLYGAGTATIAEKGRMTHDEATKFEREFWAQFPGARDWCEEVLDQVLEPPHELRNPFGRLACFGQDIADGMDSDTIRRRAISFAISSTASDVFKVNVLRLGEALPPGARIILPMHDGLLIEVPDEELDQAVEACFTQMEAPVRQADLPLGVKVKGGMNWGQMKVV